MKLLAKSEKKLIDSINVNISTHKIKVGSYVINYAVSGKGETLVLLHGANIGWGQWYPNIAEFSKYFKVYAIDLVGSGKSSIINYEDADLDKDYIHPLQIFIKKLGMKRINVVGHSFGGLIAIKLLSRNHKLINKIILTNPMGMTNFLPLQYMPTSIDLVVQILMRTVLKPSRENMAHYLKSVLENKDTISDAFVDYYFESITLDKNLRHPLKFINSLTDKFKINRKYLLLDDLKNITKKILVLHGAKDPLIPLTKVIEVYKSFPNIKLISFKGSGHVPSIENSIYFNKIVLDYLVR